MHSFSVKNCDWEGMSAFRDQAISRRERREPVLQHLATRDFASWSVMLLEVAHRPSR